MTVKNNMIPYLPVVPDNPTDGEVKDIVMQLERRLEMHHVILNEAEFRRLAGTPAEPIPVFETMALIVNRFPDPEAVEKRNAVLRVEHRRLYA